MSHPYCGVIENATGDLLKAGYTDFADDHDDATQSVRDDVPYPGRIRNDLREPGGPFDRWSGSEWVEVTP